MDYSSNENNQNNINQFYENNPKAPLYLNFGGNTYAVDSNLYQFNNMSESERKALIFGPVGETSNEKSDT